MLDLKRDLSVILDLFLAFVDHINHVVFKANQMLGFIKNYAKDFRNVNTLKILYTFLVCL